jgi:peptidoglycan-associated lipoprotein
MKMLNVGKCRLLSVVLLLLVAGAGLSGCQTVRKIFGGGKKGEPTAKVYPDGTLPPPPDAQAGKKPGDVSALPLGEKSTEPTDLGTPQPPPLREAGQAVSELKTVYFDFDSYILTDSTKATLESNNDWLTKNPGIHVLIEGHCDERGTVEYNLNLGQKRADAVREYLILKGLDAATLHTISYGEERPEVEGQTEDAYVKNRRVQFLVY